MPTQRGAGRLVLHGCHGVQRGNQGRQDLGRHRTDGGHVTIHCRLRKSIHVLRSFCVEWECTGNRLLLAAGNHARFRSSSMVFAVSKKIPAYPGDSGAPVEDLTLAPAEGRARRCDVKPVPRYKGRHRHAGEHRGSRVGTASLGSQTRGGLSYYET